MISFQVMREPFGWAVRTQQNMITPFRTRELAVREAEALACALRAHGQPAQVFVDDEGLADALVPASLSETSSRRHAL